MRRKSSRRLMKHFNYTNIMAVPKLEKIVINMGLGEAVANAKIMDVAVDELGSIAGQRPVVTRAKKSIANFKLRQNMPIGAAVTLRGERMFEFLDRLTSVVLPRVRDFRGVSTKSFDGRGNYTLGLRDQLIFPEISYEKVDKIRGMNVTIVTTARTDDEARELLKQLGMPFGNRRIEWLELRLSLKKQRKRNLPCDTTAAASVVAGHEVLFESSSSAVFVSGSCRSRVKSRASSKSSW